MKGRKPQPQPLKILRGERPDRLNDAAPTPPAVRPVKPAGLDGIAGEEWDRIVPELEAMGVLATVDTSALVVYCRSYDLWMRADAAVRETGFTIQSGDAVKTNPAVAVAHQAATTVARLLAEFGATPASRSKVKVQSVAKDELAEFLGRKRG